MALDLTGKFIYYVGPVDPVRDEVVGAGHDVDAHGWSSRP